MPDITQLRLSRKSDYGKRATKRELKRRLQPSDRRRIGTPAGASRKGGYPRLAQNGAPGSELCDISATVFPVNFCEMTRAWGFGWTEAMLEAIRPPHEDVRGQRRDHAENDWRAMIDAALAD